MGSIPGGAILQGIAYLKAKAQVYAMEDDQYPDWLWSLADSAKTKNSLTGEAAVDLSSIAPLLTVPSFTRQLLTLFYSNDQKSPSKIRQEAREAAQDVAEENTGTRAE